jgi:hypothetical protein
MDIKKLVEKWEKVLETGNTISNNKVKRATALMLENEHNYLTGGLSESGTAYGSDSLNTVGGYSGSGMFHKIAVPMVRRTFPELIAHEIVGVQPLAGPVGLAFALRFTAGTQAATYNSAVGTEIGYNTIDADYSGSYAVSAGEALGSAGNIANDMVVGANIGLGIGAGTHIKEVNMTVEKAQVEATTRKLRSRWSLEVAQDLKSMHGLNLEEEMMDILAYEITAEIDRELITTIDTAATTSTWNYAATGGTYQGRWEAERFRELFHALIRKSNRIAVLTRRGAGNFVVANPNVAAVFETLSAFTIMPVNSDITTAVTGVARLGSLDGRMTVYRDTFQSTDQFIVGFKGASEYDTGVIYLPYIQLLVSKATFEDSFNPAVGLMSRYAIHSHIFGASNYYQKVTVTNLPS